MSLDYSRMASDMYARARGMNFRGPRLMDFCIVISHGSLDSIIGKVFATVDVGVVPGTGAGIGTGLTAVSISTVQNSVVSRARNLRFKGPRLEDTALFYAQALVQELTHTTLTSAHSPVFAGAGTVVPGSIPVAVPEWNNKIFNYGRALRFIGPYWHNWCDALATGGVQGFTTATGAVVISGSPSGDPSGGGGSGAGVLS